VGELFEHIPQYTYHSEPAFQALNTFDYRQPVACKVPRPAPEQACSPGLPFEVKEFLAVFPAPRVLFWQVRHPLDAICSLRPGIQNNWGHHPRPHDWETWRHQPLLIQCAHHWNYLNTVGYQQIKDLVIVNTFEAMIDNPFEMAVRMCQMAGIDTSTCEADITDWAARVQNENTAQFVEAKCSQYYSRPDHVKKVERWKENLSDEEVQAILPLIQEGAANFGYALPS
jgi:hypothetical protein